PPRCGRWPMWLMKAARGDEAEPLLLSLIDARPSDEPRLGAPRHPAAGGAAIARGRWQLSPKPPPACPIIRARWAISRRG
ncbi:hypothetical protein VZ95_19135, partial [Elstera litoralis]